MQKAYIVVLLAVCLLLPQQTLAFRRWNWKKIGQTALKLAPFVIPFLGRSTSALDTNNDGVIDHQELARAVGERATREEMDAFMMLADADGNGSLTRREVDEFLA